MELPKPLDNQGSGKPPWLAIFHACCHRSGLQGAVGRLAPPGCHPLSLPLVIFHIHLL